jgi:hypothetical protein
MKKIIFSILAILSLALPALGQYTVPTFTAGALGSASTVATPTFSPVAGTYSSTQTVTISTTTPLAVLCYTTDGSTPTESLNLCSGGTTSTYSTPISVATTQTVKAIGTLAGSTDSLVGSAAYTISAGTPAPVGTPVCGHSAGSAFGLSYTPHAAGDGLLIVWGVSSTTETLSTVTDNGTSGGSSYTVLSGQTGQHGSARSLQLAYTKTLAASVSTITITGSTTVSSMVACVMEFSNVSAVANLTGTALTTTGTYTSGTTPQCTIANTTDYVFMGGIGSSSATAFTSNNGTVVYYNYAANQFTWGQYVADALPTGVINYAGGNMSLACVDVQ